MSRTPTHRPTWQHDTCPPWCVTHHQEHDPPEDRVHDSVGHSVPATLRHLEGPVRTDLLVVLSRRCHQLDDWVLVGEPERDGQHLLLRREDVHAVADALVAVAAVD